MSATSPATPTTQPAVDARREQLAFRTGELVVDLVRKDLKPRDILTRQAFENAVTVGMAMGGSTNMVLHLLAIAHEAGVELDMEDFHRISEKTPYMVDMKPGGKYVMTDLDRVGGVPVVMKRLLDAGYLHGDAVTLTGKTQAAERMIQTISTFYRRSLADDPTADVPLREEFALQKLYLDIEAVRFPHRLRAVYKLPPELEDAKVPGMILQPLVENSVKHAVAPTAEQVTITLAAREEYGRLVVTVSDDGQGASPGEGDKRHGHGIGVANVRDRLEARFGGEATIAAGPAPGGYSTQLRMPILRQEAL